MDIYDLLSKLNKIYSKAGIDDETKVVLSLDGKTAVVRDVVQGYERSGDDLNPLIILEIQEANIQYLRKAK